MDEFFQKLREIQKKERNLSGLAMVGENFYNDVFNYLNGLMRKIDNNPFSFESYLLRDAQRIAAEICERREHKISNSAVMNVQRSYQLFKESKLNNSLKMMKVPQNSTPEEEKLYRALIDSLANHREKMKGQLRSYDPQSHNGKNSDNSSLIVENDLNQFDNLKSSLTELKDDANPPGFSVDGGKDGDGDIYKRFGNEPSPEDVKSEIEGLKSPESNEKQPNKKWENISKIRDSVDKNIDDPHLNGILNKQNIPTETLMVLEELPSIMGVDQKVYGPFSPQDVITIPQPNARILIKNQKGRSIQRYK